MPKLTSNPGSLPEGALQFENTDFSEARRALDEPPAGLDVARKLRPPNWESRRRASLPTDHAIGGHAVDWILSLPPNVRPLNLADSTPRIANALAEYWHDPDTAAGLLEDLLVDRRGGRRGFPAQIKKELLSLHLVLNLSRRGQLPSS